MSDFSDVDRDVADASSGSDVSRGSYNTVKPSPRHRPLASFRSRMMIFFALTAVMTAGILVLVLASVWEGQFKNYTRENMQTLAENTAAKIASQYEHDGSWTEKVLSYAESSSKVSSDVMIQVVDNEDIVVYDDKWDMPESDEGMTDSLPVTFDEQTTVTADIMTSSGEEIGKVNMWASSSNALITKADAKFRYNSYVGIAVASAIAVVLACVMAVFSSRALTSPIQIITSTARQIRNGDLTARTGLSGEDEIGRLGETFDNMATTIEHDIKIERRLTSDVAHELRTPLMAMLATVEAMQDGVLPADDERLGTVTAETRRLSRLVEAMLKLSRLENGSVKVQFETTDLVKLVSGLVSMQHQLFSDCGLHLRFEDNTRDGECQARVDPDLMREAITNLLSNAMRYTPEGGWVLVSISVHRGDALIAVKDTGIGIAKEDISRTFTRFWRSDASRERASGGLGVGLSITKEIIDKHNGSILVESELGRGTTFTIRIPVDQGIKSSLQIGE